MYYGANKRSIPAVIILSLVTFGIYYFYWIYSTNEMVRRQNYMSPLTNDPVESFDTSGGMVILFSILTCGIYLIFWWYKIGRVVQSIQIREGIMQISDNSILYLIMSIFKLSIINMAILQSDLNNLWDYLDNKYMTNGYSYNGY